MADHRMVVHEGVRYRLEDAIRLGLVADPAKGEPEVKKRTPQNKARKPVNKEG